MQCQSTYTQRGIQEYQRGNTLTLDVSQGQVQVNHESIMCLPPKAGCTNYQRAIVGGILNVRPEEVDEIGQGRENRVYAKIEKVNLREFNSSLIKNRVANTR